MELKLSKEEVEEVLKEHYRNPAYIELGFSIKDVSIYENSDDFCVIILGKE